MAVTKQRKILLAVAGVAALLVIADRMVLGGATGPQQATAAAPVPAPAPSAAAMLSADTPGIAPSIAATPLKTTAESTVISLAQRLAKAEDQLVGSTPDAFAASAEWARPPAPVATPQAITPGFDPQAFARRNPLSAVTLRGGEATAMIGGQAMRLGEQREGVTLVDAGDRWVEWQGHGQRFRVRLGARP